MELSDCKKGLDSIREKCDCELLVVLAAKRGGNGTVLHHVVVSDEFPRTNPDFLVLVSAGGIIAGRGAEAWTKLREIVSDIEYHPGSVTETVNA